MRDFFEICVNGDVNKAKIIIPELDDIDVKSPEGWTGLMIACFNENKDLANLLVFHGANVNATNQKGTTVFMYAKTPVLKSQNTDLLEWLLQKGANINSKDVFDKTVLDYVEEKDVLWLVDWLKKHGAMFANELP
jgi:ankyrin repeat protein